MADAHPPLPERGWGGGGLCGAGSPGVGPAVSGDWPGEGAGLPEEPLEVRADRRDGRVGR